MTSISRHDVNALLRQVQGNSLFNRQLSSVCQVNGLKSTGVKAELQRRIVHLINDTVTHNDVARFHQVRQSIVNAFAQRTGPSKTTAARTNGSLAPSVLSPSASSTSPYSTTGFSSQRSYGQTSANGVSSSPYDSRIYGVSFKASPFYYIESARCNDDKSYRIMVFCAGDDTGVQDVAFPHQSELRVNGDEIKANLRGLKNKPGSTRPVDITNSLRLRSNYMNNIEFTYALTNKCFDATSYLQLQEQGPQWLCPICSKSAPFDQLAVDGYVKTILEKTPKSLETVTIEPNGKWSSKPPREETSSRPNGAALEDDDDDDDFEVSEIIIGGRRLETPKNLTPYTDTTGSGGRDGSSAAPRVGSHSAKRPASAVIDLTLSSDDEEPIQRPSKRQHTGTSSYRGSSSLPFLSESPSNYP
ncbi:e3 sumo- ligase pli1 [Trichoderma arundinaceum]|uniref:E3 sumo-ligase pli1 n=1 Tax=Trichoderma arundinaceum TaxID=490622 RepID=A0A395N8Q0_TRIAR|nr:e3 sumo- ligase pli1 [Trichoderma arundinaceum]